MASSFAPGSVGAAGQLSGADQKMPEPGGRIRDQGDFGGVRV
jgi:hypothetical protein